MTGKENKDTLRRMDRGREEKMRGNDKRRHKNRG